MQGDATSSRFAASLAQSGATSLRSAATLMQSAATSPRFAATLPQVAATCCNLASTCGKFAATSPGGTAPPGKVASFSARAGPSSPGNAATSTTDGVTSQGRFRAGLRSLLQPSGRLQHFAVGLLQSDATWERPLQRSHQAPRTTPSRLPVAPVAPWRLPQLFQWTSRGPGMPPRRGLKVPRLRGTTPRPLQSLRHHPRTMRCRRPAAGTVSSTSCRFLGEIPSSSRAPRKRLAPWERGTVGAAARLKAVCRPPPPSASIESRSPAV